MLPPPIPPLPPREFFPSEEAYLRAKRQRDDMMKDHEATMILMAGIFGIFLICIVVGLAYVAAGINGILGLAVGIGALVVAWFKIRERL